MNNSKVYDVIIAGGGLAGLSLATLLARKNYSVLVLEKDDYPRHKVCGEYVSMESKPFLEELGLPVSAMGLPIISRLLVTDTQGNKVDTLLPQGGFGISRYMLDNALARIAVDAGATVLTKKRVDNITFDNETFTILASGDLFSARMACGAWGKRSNMDIKWERPFAQQKNNALNNFVAVKYHVRYPWPKEYVGLHNFPDGYCGISQVEDGKCCICYLTTASSLQKHGDLKAFEQNVVAQNPWMRQVFASAEFLFESPVTISQISFDKKEQVYNHVLLPGDTAGMITPLCGNGMSMAFRAAKIAAAILDDFLKGAITRAEMEERYTREWKAVFSRRVAFGRFVQRNFGKTRATARFLKLVNALPPLKHFLVKGATGQPF